MHFFKTGLQATEFVSKLLLGFELSGFANEILDEVSEFDLRQLACEFSIRRYVTPSRLIMLKTLKVILGRVLQSKVFKEQTGVTTDLKVSLYGYYKSLSRVFSR